MISEISTINNLLKRTNVSTSFKDFLKGVEQSYPGIGKILKSNPILEGYEDANFILQTDRGKYVLKIFSTEMSTKNINDYVKVLIEAMSLGIPITEPTEGKQGYLCKLKENKGAAFYMLTKFFTGKSFLNTIPTIADIKIISTYMAELNTLKFPIEESYDSWGNKNLLKEYELNKSKLDSKQLEKVLSAVEEFRKIDFSKFTKGIIHGDMQRKHVLKNEKGEYCILDFGCMAFDPIVIDMSTYLAWFCYQKENWNIADEIYETVLAEYSKPHTFSDKELESIPVLVRASYAAYFMKTSLLIDDGDASRETAEWHNWSKEMLNLSKDWKK